MAALSPAIEATARKNESAILQAMARVTQARIAEQLGIDATAISRFKDGDLERAAAVIAACGLRVYPVDAVMWDRDKAHALLTLARHSILEAEGPEDFACR